MATTAPTALRNLRDLRDRRPVRPLLPGLGLAVAIAMVATVVGRTVPLIGGPVTGIVLGVVLGPILRPRIRADVVPGIEFASRTVLQLAVVVLGTQLSLGEVVHIGLSSLPVMVGTLAACLGAAVLIGGWLGVDPELRTLIGVGTGICGASAIAAVSSVTRPRHSNVAYAVSTIFLFNIVAVLVFPPLGHLLHMSQQAFGVFAGTAVNDTSSVVAAAASYGNQAGDHAVVVKLTRSLMIIPISLTLSVLTTRRSTQPVSGPKRTQLRQVLGLVPWFLIGFLIVATASSLGVIPYAARGSLEQVSLFLITTALAAIGFSTDLPALCRTGHRPLLLGATLWLVVTGTSLLLQATT